MNTPWYRRLSEGLTKSRDQLTGQLNVLLRKGPDLDEGFWLELEEILIAGDMGVGSATSIVERAKDSAARLALPDAAAVVEHLAEDIAQALSVDAEDFLSDGPAMVLVVGVNGTGKTTTVGKLAKEAVDAGRRVVLGSGDTFRAAAIEQLEVWADRTGVPLVRSERGGDPAAVAYDTVVHSAEIGADLILLDTAGRLHTSADLMDELCKVRRVAERESPHPVRVLLVMDATTGQNGLVQARRFSESVGVDGVALTKLDGTAKGGIAVAIVGELGVPILRAGVGEGVDDLRPFHAGEFARALIGTGPE